MDRSLKKPIIQPKPKFKLQLSQSDTEFSKNSNRLFLEAWHKQNKLNIKARSAGTLARNSNKMPLSSISIPPHNSSQQQSDIKSSTVDRRLKDELTAAINKRTIQSSGGNTSENESITTSLTTDNAIHMVDMTDGWKLHHQEEELQSRNEEIYVCPSNVNQSLSSNYETFLGADSEHLIDEIAQEVDEIYAELEEVQQDINTDKKRWQVRRQSNLNPSVSDDDESWDSSEFEDSDFGGEDYDFIYLDQKSTRIHHQPMEPKTIVRNSIIASMTFDVKRSISNTLNRTLDRQKYLTAETSKSQVWKEHMKEQRNLEDYYIDVALSDAKHPPARLPDEQPANLTMNQQKRRHIVESIASTENSFVRSMAILINNYEIPLKEQIQSGKLSSVISSDQVKILFHKLHAIHQCHRTFQIELADCVNKWDHDEKIGACFIAAFSRALLMETYQAFVENFTKLQELLRELTKSTKKKKQFVNFLSECHKSSGDPLTFDGLIVKPIQRFPQFKMLLNDLLKYTPIDHADRLDIQKAITVVESLAVLLNECKRDSEQKNEATRILGALNLRIHPKEVRENVRLLSRVKVTKKVFDADGNLTAKKERELLLFNNMLVAAENKSNEDDDSKLFLRWWKPLSGVVMGRSSLTPDMRTRLVSTSNQTVASLKDDKMAPEAKELCTQMQNLMHDFILLTQVNSTIASLRFSYETINEEEIAKTTKDLQLAIQMKEEELRLVESSTLILIINKTRDPQPDKRQVIKQKTYVYELISAKEKQSWIEQFTRAKLSCRAINQGVWQFGSSATSLPLHLSNKMPLLMKTLPVGLTRTTDNVEVVCGVPVYLAFGNIVKRHLWCCNADGSVSIVSIYNETPQISEHFYCDEGYVLCVEVVPGRPEASKFVHQIDTVWHGTTDQKIVIHSMMEGQRQGILATLHMSANVCAICYADNSVYIGLENGYILIYERMKQLEWNFKKPKSRQVGYGPVVKIVYYRDYIYLACDNQIYVIDIEFNDEDHCRGVCGKSDTDTISDFTLYGHGIWISYNDSALIRLWNLDLDVHLQEIDTSKVIETASLTFGYKEKYPIIHDCVTQLKATKNCLWIGMRSGWLCGLQLPGLEYGVPMGKGRPYVSSHAHKGPIRCIFNFQNTVERAVESITTGFQSKAAPEKANNNHFSSEQETILLNKSLKKSFNLSTDNVNLYLSNPNLIDELNYEEEICSDNSDTEASICNNHHRIESMEIQAEEEEYSALTTAVSQMNLIVNDQKSDYRHLKRLSKSILFPCEVLPISHFDNTDKKDIARTNGSIKRPSNTKKKSGNGTNVVVTTGLGYVHYAGTTKKIFKEISEAYLMIWYE